MAIAFNSHSTSGMSSGATTITFSHTTAGNNRALVVSTFSNRASAVMPTHNSVTYGGISLTRLREQMAGDGLTVVNIWVLINSPLGTHNVVVSITSPSSSDTSSVHALSFTGVQGTEGTPVGASGTGTPASLSITTLSTNSWVVDAGVADLSNNIANEGAGQTRRYFVQHNVPFGHSAWGSTKPIATAGSTTMTWGITNAGWGLAAIVLRPLPLVGKTMLITKDQRNFIAKITLIANNLGGLIEKITLAANDIISFIGKITLATKDLRNFTSKITIMTFDIMGLAAARKIKAVVNDIKVRFRIK